MAIHIRSLETSVVAPLLDKKISVRIIAAVRTDPKLGEPKQMQGFVKPATTTALVSLISLEISHRIYKSHIPLRITTAQHFSALPGSVIECSGILYSTAEKRVAGLFAEHGAISLIHGPGMIGRTTGRIRSDFREIAVRVGGASGALIPGLVLGDTSLESHSFIQSMQLAGLTHLTAVSGENFAVIAAFILWALQWVIPQTLEPLTPGTVILYSPAGRS